MFTTLSEYCSQYYKAKNLGFPVKTSRQVLQENLITEALGLSNFTYTIPKDYKQMVYDFYFLSMIGPPETLEEVMWTRAWGLQTTKGVPGEGEREDEGGLRGGFLNDEQRQELIDVTLETKKTLMNFLKKDLLDATYYAIACEFRYTVRFNKIPDVINFAKQHGVEKEFAKWYKDFQYASGMKVNNMAKKFLDDDDPLKVLALRADVYSRTPASKKRFDVDTGEEIIKSVSDQAQHFLGSSNERAASYVAAKRTWKDSDAAFINFAKNCFFSLKWSSAYGGPAWGRIAEGWEHLNNANTDLMNQVYIDHLFDLEHNTGAMLNKVKRWSKDGGWDWVKEALDFKRDAVTPMIDFWNKISPQMKYLGKKLRYAITGITDDQLVEDEFTGELKKIKLTTNSGITAGKTGSKGSTGDLEPGIKIPKIPSDFGLGGAKTIHTSNGEFYMNGKYILKSNGKPKYLVCQVPSMDDKWFETNYIVYNLTSKELVGHINKSTKEFAEIGYTDTPIMYKYTDFKKIGKHNIDDALKDLHQFDIPKESTEVTKEGSLGKMDKGNWTNLDGNQALFTTPSFSDPNNLIIKLNNLSVTQLYAIPQFIVNFDHVAVYFPKMANGQEYFENYLVLFNMNTQKYEAAIDMATGNVIKNYDTSSMSNVTGRAIIKGLQNNEFTVNQFPKKSVNIKDSGLKLDSGISSSGNGKAWTEKPKEVDSGPETVFLDSSYFVAPQFKQDNLVACYVPAMSAPDAFHKYFPVYSIDTGKFQGFINTETGEYPITDVNKLAIAGNKFTFNALMKSVDQSDLGKLKTISSGLPKHPITDELDKGQKKAVANYVGSLTTDQIVSKSSVTKMSGTFTNLLKTFHPKKIAHTGPAGKAGEKSLIINLGSPKGATGRTAYSGYFKAKMGNNKNIIGYNKAVLPKIVKLHTGKSYVGPKGDKAVAYQLRFAQVGTRLRLEGGVLANASIDLSRVEISGNMVFVNCNFVMWPGKKVDWEQLSLVGCTFNGKKSYNIINPDASGSPFGDTTILTSRYQGPKHSHVSYSFI